MRDGRIIGINGLAKSGKDTACEFLQLELAKQGVKVERDAFADRLKISAARAIGCTGPNSECIDDMNWIKDNGYVAVYDETGNLVSGITGREYLQYYGTEAHRNVFGQDFWIEAVLPNPALPYAGRDTFDVLVITDVRFDNEAKAVRDAGGEVWQIQRKSQIKESEHASELALDPELVDVIVANNGTLEEFKDCVIKAMSVIV